MADYLTLVCEAFMMVIITIELETKMFRKAWISYGAVAQGVSSYTIPWCQLHSPHSLHPINLCSFFFFLLLIHQMNGICKCTVYTNSMQSSQRITQSVFIDIIMNCYNCMVYHLIYCMAALELDHECFCLISYIMYLPLSVYIMCMCAFMYVCGVGGGWVFVYCVPVFWKLNYVVMFAGKIWVQD